MVSESVGLQLGVNDTDEVLQLHSGIIALSHRIPETVDSLASVANFDVGLKQLSHHILSRYIVDYSVQASTHHFLVSIAPLAPYNTVVCKSNLTTSTSIII